MSARIQYDTVLVAASVNLVAQTQTPLAGGNLTLNGAGVAGGVATMDSGGAARQLLFTFAASEAARTFVITGTVLEGGALVTETLAGGAATSVSVNYFFTVTNISIDAASAGAIQVGTNGIGSSPPKVLDRKIAPSTTSIMTILKGSTAVNWTIQYTHNDVFDRTAIPVWVDDATITAKSANFEGSRSTPCMAMRTKINSGTGTVTTIAEQGDRIS